MNTLTRNNTYQSGIGLLEVLIAVAVLSIALLSLGGLHSKIIKSSNDAKVKALATSLASEKLDDLRSYGSTSVDSAFTFAQIDAAASGTDTFTANAGTTFQNDANVSFTRRWYHYGLYVCADNTAPTTNPAACSPSRAGTTPDMVLINVSVGWTDLNNNPQSVALQSVISNTETNAAKNIIGATTAGGPQKICNTISPYNTLCGQDISISMGDVLKRVSQPVPDTNRSTANNGDNDTTSNTVTSFREEYYNTTNQLIGETEFVTVNCYCAQQSATDAFGYDPTYLKYNASTLKNTKFIAGDYVNKHVGATATGTGLNDQPKVCDICCRDHHDRSSAPHLYDPFRPSADYIGSDHNHYQSGAAPSFAASTLANANNATYAEACRMAWVGGNLKTLQDWRLESLVILTPGYLSDSANLTKYTDYVAAFVTKFVLSIGTSYPGTMPDRSTIYASTNTYAVAGGRTILSVHDTLAALPTDWTTSVNSTSHPDGSDWDQLMARGIYIDYMDADLINTIRCKIDPNTYTPLTLPGTTFNSCPNTAKEDYLYLIPFHDVNLTKLSNWSAVSTDIAVKSDRLLDGNETTFSRGKVAASSLTTGTGVVASIQTSNTGQTVTEAIDPEDYSNGSVNPVTACIGVKYTGATMPASPCTPVTATRITGTVTPKTTTTAVVAESVYITVKNPSNGATCAIKPGTSGVYDTSACGNLLLNATSVQLYIWNYTNGSDAGGNTKDDCVTIGSYTTNVPSTSSGRDESKCTGSSCSSTDILSTSSGSQGEYTLVTLTVPTANQSYTFNFGIKGDTEAGTCAP